jgi:hypothetical protein
LQRQRQKQIPFGNDNKKQRQKRNTRVLRFAQNDVIFCGLDKGELMAILVVGSVAFDTIETPHGKRVKCLGGAGGELLYRRARDRRGG